VRAPARTATEESGFTLSRVADGWTLSTNHPGAGTRGMRISLDRHEQSIATAPAGIGGPDPQLEHSFRYQEGRGSYVPSLKSRFETSAEDEALKLVASFVDSALTLPREQKWAGRHGRLISSRFVRGNTPRANASRRSSAAAMI